MEKPSPDEHRRSAWTALSALFIDNEIGPGEYGHAAGELLRAGFSRAEAEQILREEVAPVFVANLWSVAGEWQPWSKQDVARIMDSQLPRSWWAKLTHPLRVRLARKTADEIWQGLEPHLKGKATSP